MNATNTTDLFAALTETENQSIVQTVMLVMLLLERLARYLHRGTLKSSCFGKKLLDVSIRGDTPVIKETGKAKSGAELEIVAKLQAALQGMPAPKLSAAPQSLSYE